MVVCVFVSFDQPQDSDVMLQVRPIWPLQVRPHKTSQVSMQLFIEPLRVLVVRCMSGPHTPVLFLDGLPAQNRGQLEHHMLCQI